LFAFSSIGQQTNTSPSLSQQNYLDKSKKQKKLATLLLAGGAGLIITSLVIPRGDLTEDGICVGGFCDKQYQNDDMKSAFFIAGGVAALGSIPFFMAAKKNKRKAGLVSFHLERALQLHNQNIVFTTFPAVRLKIDL
jgi:hypothetical protein